MARVDLIIGGENKGTFYFGDEYPAEYTIENVKHKTGDQKVQLIVNSDDGNWDAYVDYLLIGSGLAAGTGTSNGNASSGNKPSANTKLVALTFDDGPSPTTTNQVLDILEKYNVPGTFFLIGKQVTPDTREIMERQLSLGCELGSHSYTHEDMSMMSANDVRNQMTWTSSAIKNTVNYDVKFFRPPYLAVSNTMYQNIDLDFIQGIDSGDWQSNVSANERANNVLKNVKDGSIILMHDFEGNNNTVQALPTIIEGLQKQGYTLVTVSELFKQKGVNPGVEYKIWSNVLE
ncbi:MAG: polysaccharide deacetylase family protein [Eubacteriales bacterium]|nr:polysaccharide deacetylase family protein [Eubacteriales bacterium]